MSASSERDERRDFKSKGAKAGELFFIFCYFCRLAIFLSER